MIDFIWEFIHKVGIWVSKKSFVLFKYTGYVFTFWLPKILGNRLTIIPLVSDFEDSHTFRHFSVSMIGTLAFWIILNVNIFLSALLSFLIGWIIWEIIIDGMLKASDARGYQISDTGADFWGALTPVIIYLIGRCL